MVYYKYIISEGIILQHEDIFVDKYTKDIDIYGIAVYGKNLKIGGVLK